jgi:ligand-binding sensor domain-containing protein
MTLKISGRWKKRYGFLCVLFCLPLLIFSQSLSYKNFTVDDGLPSSTLYAAFQDSRGFMWFASDLGVSRYDGYTFTNFTSGDGLPDNEVFNFLEDRTGKIWFSTLNGNTGYYKNGVIFNSTTDTTLRSLDSKSSIFGLYVDEDGVVWMSTFKDGLVAYTEDKKVHRFLDDGTVHKLNSFRPTGRKKFVLFGGYGIYKASFNQKADSMIEFGNYNFTLDPALSFSKSIMLDSNKTLFTDRGTIFIGDLAQDKFSYLINEKSDSLIIYNLCKDDDYLWVCTNAGALRYSLKDLKFIDCVLKDYKISSVVKDSEKNYWITTLGDGVFFCSFNAMYKYTVKDGLQADRVTCLAKDQANRIWAGHEKGVVSLIDRKKVNPVIITHERFRNSCRVRRIYTNKNRTWFATSIGLHVLEDGKISFNAFNARDVAEYPDNNVWVGNSERLFLVEKQTFLKYSDGLTSDPDNYKMGLGFVGTLRRERSKAIFVDSDHNVWMATEKSLYKGDANSPVTQVSPDKFNNKLNINDFDELKDKTLLIASNGAGLIFLKDGKYNSIDVKDGLSSGICNAVAADDTTIWVATNKGLNKITGYPNAVKIEYFNVYDGLLSNEITDVLVCNDTVWAGTKNGLNFFYKDYRRKYNFKPRILLEDMVVHGKTIALDEKHDDLVFAHNENDIKINFLSPLFNSIGAVVYRYKLHGDAPWKYTKSPFVYFSELQSGSYDFSVEASGRQGIWSNEASISFVIKVPFYRSNLFIAGEVLLFILIVAVIVNIYIKNQKLKADMKQRIVVSELQTLRAQMNPHFLFNALNSIQDLFLNNDAKTAQNYIGKFGKLMRSLLDHSSLITIAEEVTTITNYLEIEQLRMNHRFNYKIEIDPAIDVHTIEMPSMIIQPFIENSIWHGFTQDVIDAQLNINFDIDGDDYVAISLKDNGIGRKKSAARNNKKNHNSKGIHLIMERIDILNFGNSKKITLSIHDLEDERGNNPGTLVKIKIPLAI